MLKLSCMEFFTRLVPEMLLIIWGIYVINKQFLSFKRYIFTSISMALLVYFVRMLPVYFGVHMIIVIILLISILTITGIKAMNAIYSTLFLYFLLNLCEFLNVILLEVLNIPYNYQSENLIMKSISGIPSLILLALFIVILKQKEGIRNVFNRKYSN